MTVTIITEFSSEEDKRLGNKPVDVFVYTGNSLSDVEAYTENGIFRVEVVDSYHTLAS